MTVRLVVLLGVLACGGAWAQDNLVLNAGMEDGNGVAPPAGWVHNSYGELDAAVAWDGEVCHEGRASLRLQCGAFRGGAAQAYVPIAGVTTGETYTLSAWVRGEGLAAPVQLGVRDVGVPYHFYLSASGLATGEWRPLVVTAKADLDGGAVGVFVNFQSAGTLWLDAVSLETGEHPVASDAADVAVVKGNLVQNGGFELGLQGWAMPEAVAVEDGGVAGKCAHWLGRGGYMVEGRPMELKPGQRYTYSAWLKAPAEGTRVSMALREVGGSDAHAQEFALTGEWQRLSFAFVAAPQQSLRYYQSFTRTAGGDFAVDQVQLEEGDLTSYSAARGVEAGFDLARSQRFPGVGEEVTIGVRVWRSGAEQTAQLRLTGTDYFGREVFSVPVAYDRAEQRFTERFEQPGYVLLALEDMTDGSPVTLDEAQLCVTAPVPADDIFFGGHGTEGTPGEYHAITAQTKAGTRLWRMHDMPCYTQWFMVQPEEGQWVWYDAEIDAMRSKGLELLGVFCRTPKWAGRDPGGEPVDSMAWPPRDWDEFAEYVFRTVEHYKGRIKYWESWNEPWGRGFWAGTPEEFAKLQQIVYEQAKRADPECVIVGGCFWPPMPEFTDRVLAAGGIETMDAVSYHHYCEPDAVAMGQVADWYQTMRSRIDAAGRPDMPIWMTEGGTSCPTFSWWMGRRDQARAAAETVAKHQIQTKAAGAKTFCYYYTWQEIGSPRVFHWLQYNTWNHLDYDGSPKTIFTGYAGVGHALAGGEPVGKVEGDGLFAYVFRRGNETAAALWAAGALREPRRVALTIGDGARVADMMGADMETEREGAATVLRLGSAPVYVTSRGVGAEELLRELGEGE